MVTCLFPRRCLLCFDAGITIDSSEFQSLWSRLGVGVESSSDLRKLPMSTEEVENLLSAKNVHTMASGNKPAAMKFFFYAKVGVFLGGRGPLLTESWRTGILTFLCPRVRWNAPMRGGWGGGDGIDVAAVGDLNGFMYLCASFSLKLSENTWANIFFLSLVRSLVEKTCGPMGGGVTLTSPNRIWFAFLKRCGRRRASSSRFVPMIPGIGGIRLLIG